jgi:hypothetical protein
VKGNDIYHGGYMTEIASETVYFNQTGPENTERTLEIARARMVDLGLRTVVVASTEGATGARAADFFKGFNVIVVSHSTGFDAPNTQQMTPENRKVIEARGTRILTCGHAFGGVNRAVRKQFETVELDEIIAHTLRIFGQGVKVIAEMSLMAADAGLVRTDTPIMGIAGTGNGSDTAAIVLPTNAQTFFDLKFLEIVCWPSPNHPGFNK